MWTTKPNKQEASGFRHLVCLIVLLFETDIWDNLSWTKEYFIAQTLTDFMEFSIMISFTKSINFISDVSLKSPCKE